MLDTLVLLSIVFFCIYGMVVVWRVLKRVNKSEKAVQCMKHGCRSTHYY